MVEDTVKKNLDEVFDIAEDEIWEEPEILRDIDGNPIGAWTEPGTEPESEEAKPESEPETLITDMEIYEPSTLVIEPDNLDMEDLDKLGEEVLKNLGDLHKDLRYMLQDAIITAKATGHPQGYAAVASLSKALLSVVGEKMGARKKIQDMVLKSKEDGKATPKNVINNLYVGTTSDLLKDAEKIREAKKRMEEIIKGVEESESGRSRTG